MQQAPSRGLAPMAGVPGTSSRMTTNRRQVAAAAWQQTDSSICIPVEIMSLNVRKSVINELCVATTPTFGTYAGGDGGGEGERDGVTWHQLQIYKWWRNWQNKRADKMLLHDELCFNWNKLCVCLHSVLGVAMGKLIWPIISIRQFSAPPAPVAMSWT